jgi:signal transduction histidine kinase
VQSAPVELSLSGSPEKLKIKCDSLKLQQVLVNLIQNAQQHTDRALPIKIVVDKKGDKTVRVRIIDGGKGIPVENFPRLFEPFFTTRKSGTGLGLCIARHIIKSHNGEIRLYNNNPGPGLTAEILLPRCPE